MRSTGLALLLVLSALLAAACGKFGPPRRTGTGASTSGALPSSPIPGMLNGPEGTGILNPQSDPQPAPMAPAELPDDPEDEAAP